MVSIATVLNESSNKLEEVSGNNSKREAKILLEFSIKSQGKLFQLDHEISEDSYVFFKTLLEKRLNFQPISQIIGQRYFWKSKFLVTSDVLDPRPDTETLIEHTLSLGKFNRILDLGTGSGCIGISIAKYNPSITVYGIDYSLDALEVAQINKKNKLLDNFYLINSDTIFAEFKHNGIPPPGCTLPPQKYKFLIFLEKLGCLKNADISELLELP